MSEPCSLCHRPTDHQVLAEVNWLAPEVLDQLGKDNPHWKRGSGVCPSCIQQALLEILLEKGEPFLQDAIQSVWPLDAEAAFGAVPTALRMRANPHYTGKGQVIAMVDSGFYPHPDLIQPENRIRAWVDASTENVQARYFRHDEIPTWPGWDQGADWQWHGLMTSTVATGNGWLSHGLYCGLARRAELVLIQVRDAQGRISNSSICRALDWLHAQGPALNVRVVNLSVSGDPVPLSGTNPVDERVGSLALQGVNVVSAAGNSGTRLLIPPATAPEALTIGGLDDHNTFDADDVALWHSNYGESLPGVFKPELVAPSIWVVAPLLPSTDAYREAAQLFETRTRSEDHEQRTRAVQEIGQRKLITPYYQHVDGTSFAAPLIASLIACMVEANPQLSVLLVRDILMRTAHPLPNVPREKQGSGAVEAGAALAVTLMEGHAVGYQASPVVSAHTVTFFVHDDEAQQVEVCGNWNDWSGQKAKPNASGLWTARISGLSPGQYQYKFRIDGQQWREDLANPYKRPDNYGGFNSTFTVPEPD